MSDPDPRASYAAWTEALITAFRSNGGKVTAGPFADRDVLLLTTVGAKSGQERLAPVVFTRDGDRIVIVGSKNGAPTHPGWYHNLLANPIVTLEVGTEKFQARATPAEGAERERLWAAHVARYPGFQDYLTKTSRVIPVIVLERLP
jgi:deazaflavin-dependent oxidoreductase (nitroreductase family)